MVFSKNSHLTLYNFAKTSDFLVFTRRYILLESGST